MKRSVRDAGVAGSNPATPTIILVLIPGSGQKRH
jgi:hypothetical protein